jgi:hypothetical protein
MNRISLTAFFLGNLCDMLLTVAGSAAIVLYTQAHVRHPGMSPHDVHAAALALRAHGTLRILSYAVGVVASLIAGFIGGRLGRPHSLLNGVLSDTIFFCLGLMILATHSSRDPIPLQFGLIALSVAAAALGGGLVRPSTAA